MWRVHKMKVTPSFTVRLLSGVRPFPSLCFLKWTPPNLREGWGWEGRGFRPAAVSQLPFQPQHPLPHRGIEIFQPFDGRRRGSEILKFRRSRDINKFIIFFCLHGFQCHTKKPEMTVVVLLRKQLSSFLPLRPLGSQVFVASQVPWSPYLHY